LLDLAERGRVGALMILRIGRSNIEDPAEEGR
jgi:hypothetical protein